MNIYQILSTILTQKGAGFLPRLIEYMPSAAKELLLQGGDSWERHRSKQTLVFPHPNIGFIGYILAENRQKVVKKRLHSSCISTLFIPNSTFAATGIVSCLILPITAF